MLRIVIDVNTPAGYAQAVKEDLAMHLERWGDARVVDVREAYTVKPAGGIAKKIDCQQCGKRRYGVTYQIEKK